MRKRSVILVSLLCGGSLAFGDPKDCPDCAEKGKTCERCAAAKAAAGSEGVPPKAPEPATPPAAPDPVAPKPKVYTPEEECRHCRTLGRYIRKQASVDELGLSPECVRCTLEGFQQGGEVEPEALKEAMPYFQQKAMARAKEHEAEVKRIAEENRKKSEAFFQALDKDPEVLKTDSGLRYKILKMGEGEHPGRQHEVILHYVGKLLDGTEFDSSRKRGEPASFPLAHVLPGFTEGVPLVARGGSLRLWIPSELGYGDQEIPGIPPGSTLDFEIELIDFREAPKFDLEALKTRIKEAEEKKDRLAASPEPEEGEQGAAKESTASGSTASGEGGSASSGSASEEGSSEIFLSAVSGESGSYREEEEPPVNFTPASAAGPAAPPAELSHRSPTSPITGTATAAPGSSANVAPARPNPAPGSAPASTAATAPRPAVATMPSAPVAGNTTGTPASGTPGPRPETARPSGAPAGTGPRSQVTPPNSKAEPSATSQFRVKKSARRF